LALLMSEVARSMSSASMASKNSSTRPIAAICSSTSLAHRARCWLEAAASPTRLVAIGRHDTNPHAVEQDAKWGLRETHGLPGLAPSAGDASVPPHALDGVGLPTRSAVVCERES
jgi:hypothetical protein